MPKDHIKSIGSYPIVVRLHPEVQVTVSLEVVTER
jgi:ribosomal protein L9